MPKLSSLKFNNYTVDELYYKQVPISGAQKAFELRPDILKELTKINDKNYDLHLTVELMPTVDYPLPFEIRVGITGHFEFIDGEDPEVDALKYDVLKKNTVAILFPFLRATLAALTNTANIPPLILPIMNFSQIET